MDPHRTTVVTLDGVAIPLVDPQNFQEFWNEREEEKMREAENNLRYASKTKDNQDSPPGSGSINTTNQSPPSFYSSGQQQGAVTFQGEGKQQQQQQQTNRSRTRQRPQSAQRTRNNMQGKRKQGRPSSAMSRTAPISRSRSGGHGNGSRPASAQPSRRRRRRPKSARLSGTTGQGARRIGDRVIPSGSEEDRRRVMEDYANSIKAQRRVRPTSSADYIKLRAARRRQQAKEFADSLKDEEKRKKIEIHSKVQEMNKWVLSNGADVNYQVVTDKNASNAHGFAVHVLARGTLKRRLGIGSFEREHDKMKIEMDRKKALRALSSDHGGGNHEGHGNHNGSPNRKMSLPQRASSRGRSRRVVQNELKSILTDTEALTITLVGQLKELRNCGWNIGYI